MLPDAAKSFTKVLQLEYFLKWAGVTRSVKFFVTINKLLSNRLAHNNLFVAWQWISLSLVCTIYNVGLIVSAKKRCSVCVVVSSGLTVWTSLS